MLTCRSAATTSSAADSGTSTREKRSAISIAPISRPERFDSPAIAATRSCGRTPAERAVPQNGGVLPPGRGAPPPGAAAGGLPLVTWSGLPAVAAVARRQHFDG